MVVPPKHPKRATILGPPHTWSTIVGLIHESSKSPSEKMRKTQLSGGGYTEQDSHPYDIPSSKFVSQKKESDFQSHVISFQPLAEKMT